MPCCSASTAMRHRRDGDPERLRHLADAHRQAAPPGGEPADHHAAARGVGAGGGRAGEEQEGAPADRAVGQGARERGDGRGGQSGDEDQPLAAAVDDHAPGDEGEHHADHGCGGDQARPSASDSPSRVCRTGMRNAGPCIATAEAICASVLTPSMRPAARHTDRVPGALGLAPSVPGGAGWRWSLHSPTPRAVGGCRPSHRILRRRCQRVRLRWTHASHDRPAAHGRPVRGRLRRSRPRETSPRPSPTSRRRIRAGEQNTVLLGATGTGKSATTAWLIEQVQRPTLVMAPNKTLAAQLANEFRELLPNNAVEYFVSYYDYYQPEAYIPQTDTYIEKDSSINDEVERLRHSATNSLLTRRDVIVVASVSCIYGLGTPQEYVDRMARLRVGQEVNRDDLLRRFVQMQYTRNDLAFTRGTFRVRGDTVEIIPVYEELAVRIEFFGDEIERIYTLHPVSGEIMREEQEMYVFPATHYVAGPERMERAIRGIELELADQLAAFEKQGKLLEAQRLRMRTTYDIEMMRQVGSCSGIENYSMHIDGRGRGTAPNTLLDYFPEDFLLVIDESHVTVPQIGAMYEGDMSRKRQLVDHGFRLPVGDGQPAAALGGVPRPDRPDRLPVGDPGPLRARRRARAIVEQIIRPTGLIDPEVILKPTKGQIDDLLHEIGERTKVNERVLVTTLTKKMAEDLTDYLLDKGVRVRYLHSEVDTLRRVELLRELRMGEYDVLVGINLLREGLDLPEVSLVSILDADKEGFLRSARSLIQTIGRAARNVSGQVHMYADKITPSMQEAIDETQRRREKQVAYNLAAGVDPQPLRKKIADITDLLNARGRRHRGAASGRGAASRGARAAAAVVAARVQADAGVATDRLRNLPANDLANLIQELSAQMHQAAADLHFELAARLRDEIGDLKKELRQMSRPADPVTPERAHATHCLAKPGAWAGPALGGRLRRQGRRQDLRLPGQRVGRAQVRRQPGRGRRVGPAVPRRRLGDGLHRPLRLEHPAARRRDPRRRAPRGGRRVLRHHRRQAPEEPPTRPGLTSRVAQLAVWQRLRHLELGWSGRRLGDCARPSEGSIPTRCPRHHGRSSHGSPSRAAYRPGEPVRTSRGGRDLRPPRCDRKVPPVTAFVATTAEPDGSRHLGLVPHHRPDGRRPALRRLHHRPAPARAVDEGGQHLAGRLHRRGPAVRPRRLVLHHDRPAASSPPSTTPAG